MLRQHKSMYLGKLHMGYFAHCAVLYEFKGPGVTVSMMDVRQVPTIVDLLIQKHKSG